MPQIKSQKEKRKYDILTKTNFYLTGNKDAPETKYMKYRAQYIANQKVITYLNDLKKIDLVYDPKFIDELIWRYEYFTSLGKKKSDTIYVEHKEIIDAMNATLYEK